MAYDLAGVIDMFVKLLALLLLGLSSTVWAEEPIWFVAVYGENMQPITGASSTLDVVDGVFLDPEYVGTEIYVRVEKGYELDGFRPPDNTSTTAVSGAISEVAGGAAASAPAEAKPRSEFGPLTDTGVQYYLDGDYFGWFCAALYVKPMGNGVDRLRCDNEMSHSN